MKYFLGKSPFRSQCILGVLVVIGLVSCIDQKPKQQEKAKGIPLNKRSEMIDRTLASFIRHPTHLYLHENSSKADFAYNQMQSKTGAERFQLNFTYANELLNSGKTELAITELENLTSIMENGGTGITPNNKIMWDILAVAHLRLGEEQNCCAQHNDESCLFPLRGKAIHTIRRGSEGAIKIYTQILNSYPEDMQSRYLLNVAYMTLGEYPQNVPKIWLLPDLDKKSDIDFPVFKDVAISTGSDIIGLSGGVCIEDFNGDLMLDIICSSYGLDDQLIYLQRNANGGYTDKTEEAGLIGITSGLNMVHADYDNDGDADILLLRGAWLREQGAHPNSLIRNNGDGTFTDVTIANGIYSERPTQNACWADFNNDGWLDLFIGNECDKRDKDQLHPCELFINLKDGRFKEVGNAAGIQSFVYAKGSCSADYNSDGLTDIFVSNLYGNNILYVNQGNDANGIPIFKDNAKLSGVQEPRFSFPCWFFDYDNDGHQDLFVADYDLKGFSNLSGEVAMELAGEQSTAEKPKLYHNNGDGTFKDVTSSLGLNRSFFAMGSNFGDLNNDGFLDFYIGNGAPDLRMIVPNLMFLNQNGKRFTDVTTNGRFGNLQKGHAVGFGDLDNDGDQDIYAVMGGAVEGDTYQNVLFENPGWNNQWVSLILSGTTSNKSAIGALVEIRTIKNGKPQSFYRRIGTGGSFGSSSLRLEFGLGQIDSIESILVNWPNGRNLWKEYSGAKAKHTYRITEGNPKLVEINLPTRAVIIASTE